MPLPSTSITTIEAVAEEAATEVATTEVAAVTGSVRVPLPPPDLTSANANATAASSTSPVPSIPTPTATPTPGTVPYPYVLRRDVKDYLIAHSEYTKISCTGAAKIWKAAEGDVDAFKDGLLAKGVPTRLADFIESMLIPTNPTVA